MFFSILGMHKRMSNTASRPLARARELRRFSRFYVMDFNRVELGGRLPLIEVTSLGPGDHLCLHSRLYLGRKGS